MQGRTMRYAGLALVLALAAPAPAFAQDCDSGAQEQRIEATVRDFFRALAADDRPALDRTISHDFYAFDAGEMMTANDLFTAIVEAHRGGRVINWSIGPMTVRATCRTALATWENIGSAGIPLAMVPRRWLESATLRRSGQGWKIDFLHSSRVDPLPSQKQD